MKALALPVPLRLLLIALCVSTASADSDVAAPPLRVPPHPELPEITFHPGQPRLPDLHNAAGEAAPSYQRPTDRFVGLFAPFRTDRAALSPDGKYLAYSVREQGATSVVVVEVDHPEKATARVTVATDESSTPMLAENQREKTPARIRWMRWTTPTRLAVDTNAAFAIAAGTSWVTRTGAVFAFDADGRNARLIATPRDVAELIPYDMMQAPDQEQSSGQNSQGPSASDDAGAATKMFGHELNSRSIWSVDQPVPDPTGGSEPDPFSDAALMAARVNESVQSGKTSPQDLRVIDLAPGHPGGVLVQTFGEVRPTGSRRVGAFLLDTVTGKLTPATDEIVPGLHEGLVDRAGHVRLTLPISQLTPFPHRYAYLGATGASRSRPLDDAVPATVRASAAFAVSPENFFAERAIPLGFGDDPDVFYYASNAGRDTFGVYSLSLSTGQPGPFPLEDPTYDLVPPIETFGRPGDLIIDRFYHRLAGVRFDAALGTAKWIYPSFQEVQQALQTALPGHTVDILEWNESGTRFLVSASAPGDAGAFYIFDRDGSRLRDFVRRAPWIDANQTHKTYPFTISSETGARLTGLMTIPNHPRLKPMPALLLCPDQPWQRARPDFADRVQALADMGFLVFQLNGRGAWGLGVKNRAALAAGYDLVQVADLAALVAHIKASYDVDPKRIALFGESHGGFIALRALQLHPDLFRCAVVLNAPVDLGGWLEDQRWTGGAAGPALIRSALGDAARLREAPLVRHPELVTKPVFFLHYGGPDGAPRDSTYLGTKSFAAAVRRAGGSAEFADLTTDYMRGFPQARSDAYQQIEDFLNVTIYDFKVKMGDLKVKPDHSQKKP